MFSLELTSWDREKISIGLIWLFHLSAIIGISIGFETWFAAKTPLNLVLAFLLLVLNFPIDTPRKIWLAVTFFTMGMLAEWIGVHQGFLFGSYSYGNNLGIKLDGVPLLIGVNWCILVLITGAIANFLTRNNFLRIFTGAGLMVFLDFFLEHTAPRFDFWTFAGGIAPFKNYLAWFIIAIVMHVIFQAYKIRGNFRFSLHLYFAQLFFFFYFFWSYTG